MRPSSEDLERIVYPLTRIAEAMRRAQARDVDPTRIAILREAGTKGRVRPSEIAADLGLHQSSIARSTRVPEDAGHVRVDPDPDDRRPCLISLTDAGWDEVRRLTALGLDRFADFLESWDVEDVHRFGELLTKFEESVAEVKAREASPGGRRRQKKGNP
ncbi:MarR family winged helix-turn-helix transcriptional regulator [Actinosynnema sp. NPDC020468]|uniref:MarR family winged helix-turn-helix transcriptional regulator n=1 Tax=Actinosynnema sp. NPDC020468 TaxID=3154488 RepID=UPI0033D83675